MSRGRVRRPPRQSLIAAGLGLAATVVAIFLLFGSSSNPAFNPIAQAATVSSNAPGYRMNMSVTLTSSALSGPITAHADAIVDPRDHATSMSFAMDFSSVPQVSQVLGGTTMSMQMIMDGHFMYMKLPQALLGRIPNLGTRSWLKVDAAKAYGLPGLSSIGSNPSTSDPRQLLQYLRGESDGVTDEGQQPVDGVPTTHYHAEISLDRVAAGLPAAEQSAVRQVLSKLRQTMASSELPIDVWIDAHHLVRRMATSLSLHVGPQSLQESLVADMTDYGPQPRPTIPPADQVQDATGLLAAGGGLSG